MKLKLPVLFILFLIFQSCNSQKEKSNGLSFVAAPEKISHSHIIPIKKVSANSVSLMPFAFIKNLNAPEVKFNSSKQWFGETEAGIIQYASLFKKEGIGLMLSLIHI